MKPVKESKKAENPAIKTKEFKLKKNYLNLKKDQTIKVDSKGESFYKSLNII